MIAVRRILRVVGYGCDVELRHDPVLAACWLLQVLVNGVPLTEQVGSRNNGPSFLPPNPAASRHHLTMRGSFLDLPSDSWAALRDFCEDVRRAEAVRREATESLPSHLPHIAAPSSLETRQ